MKIVRIDTGSSIVFRPVADNVTLSVAHTGNENANVQIAKVVKKD